MSRLMAGKRIYNAAVLKPRQPVAFPLEVIDFIMRKRFERPAEPLLTPLCSPGNALYPAVVPGIQ